VPSARGDVRDVPTPRSSAGFFGCFLEPDPDDEWMVGVLQMVHGESGLQVVRQRTATTVLWFDARIVHVGCFAGVSGAFPARSCASFWRRGTSAQVCSTTRFDQHASMGALEGDREGGELPRREVFWQGGIITRGP
jgi:hypothetical protein